MEKTSQYSTTRSKTDSVSADTENWRVRNLFRILECDQASQYWLRRWTNERQGLTERADIIEKARDCSAFVTDGGKRSFCK